MDGKARLSQKSGYRLSDILLEKCRGVTRGDGRTADCSTMTGNDRASKRMEAGLQSCRGGTSGAHRRTSASWSQARGADPGPLRLRGLKAAGPKGWLRLEHFNCFSFWPAIYCWEFCCVNVCFAVWWLILHCISLIRSVHLTAQLLNNLLHKWVSILQPPLLSPLMRAMHSLWELCNDSGHLPFKIKGTGDALGISAMLMLNTGRKGSRQIGRVSF